MACGRWLYLSESRYYSLTNQCNVWVRSDGTLTSAGKSRKLSHLTPPSPDMRKKE